MKQLPGMSPSGLFATQTLTGHVIRGAVAFALLYLAIGKQDLHPVASLLAGLLALATVVQAWRTQHHRRVSRRSAVDGRRGHHAQAGVYPAGARDCPAM